MDSISVTPERWSLDMKIDIAKDFSEYPAGRTLVDGPDSGERFRTDFLVPALNKASLSGETVVLQIDGVRTFGSSFLEEAFGGLIRNKLFERKDIEKYLKITYDRESFEFYKDLIIKYLNDAQKET